MKKFWLVLLSLGLVMAFSASAFAVDVKVSGEFYVGGMYLDKTTFKKDTAADGPSTAFYYQRLRVGTEFMVSPGLKLVTRFDALERIWGGARSTTPDPITAAADSSGTRAENENIAFDWAYVEYASPIGLFKVGIMEQGVWGTQFADSKSQIGRIYWSNTFGPVYAGVYIGQTADLSKTAIYAGKTADADSDKLVAWVGYKTQKNGNFGILYNGARVATARATTGATSIYHVLEPYAKLQFGPVYVEAEVDYAWGDFPKYEDGLGNDVKLDNWIAYIMAKADFGPVYFGGTFAFIAGDDPNTTDKKEGGILSGGTEWNPCLIMFNYDRYYWAGAIAGQGTSTNNSPMSNAWFYQGKVGVKPTAKLDIMGTVSYAKADQKPTGYQNDSYGWEADIVGTYKITNNLSYMLGFGYLFTGDYYKGATSGTSVRDDYMVTNKLTLTF